MVSHDRRTSQSSNTSDGIQNFNITAINEILGYLAETQLNSHNSVAKSVLRPLRFECWRFICENERSTATEFAVVLKSRMANLARAGTYGFYYKLGLCSFYCHLINKEEKKTDGLNPEFHYSFALPHPAVKWFFTSKTTKDNTNTHDQTKSTDTNIPKDFQ